VSAKVDGLSYLDPHDQKPLLSFVHDVLPGGPAAGGLPVTAKGFDTKTRRPHDWLRLSGGLTIRRVLDHLAGKITLSLPPPREYPANAPRYFEIDLDRHYVETESWDSVVERAVACGRALDLLRTPPRPSAQSDGTILSYGEWTELHDSAFQMRRLLAVPGVVLWRSSAGRPGEGCWWPGGVRLRVYVKWSGSDAELRECVVGMLTAGGVEVKGGHVEVWPHGDRPTRVPLGSGSCVLDEDGSPRFASDGNGRLLRHLGADIEYFSDAAREPLPLPKVTWASNLRSSNCGTHAQNDSEKEEGRRRRHRAQRAAKRRDGADAAHAPRTISDPGPLTQRGQRVITSGRFLCYLRTGLGLTLEQAKPIYEKWLRRTDHVGDLAVTNPRREKFIDQMLRDMPGDFAGQDKKVAAGQLISGKRGRGSKPKRTFATPGVSIDKLLAHVTASQIQAALTANDLAVLEKQDRWLTARLRSLVGCIRLVQELDGPITKLAVTYRAVERIAGTRRPRGWEQSDSLYYEHRSRKTGGLGTAPYRVVLDAAQRLGFLGRVVTDGEPGLTATIYELP